MSKETPKKDMDNRRIFMTSHKTLSLYQTSLLTLSLSALHLKYIFLQVLSINH